jgi:hypothetical protein
VQAENLPAFNINVFRRLRTQVINKSKSTEPDKHSNKKEIAGYPALYNILALKKAFPMAGS